MARPRQGEALIRLRVEGAGELARDLDRASRKLQDTLIRRMRALGLRGQAILREEVIRSGFVDSGDLLESIDARFSTRTAAPRLTFTAETRPGHPGAEDGYPYVAVTRFGHRKATISPKPGSALRIHAPGRETSSPRVAPVRGFGHGTAKRPHDWVRDAEQRIDREGDEVLRRIGRDVDSVLLPGHRAR